MKKIISTLVLTGALFAGTASVFAYHQSGQMYSIPTYSSYTYTSGCNVYRYDPYTRASTFLYTTCQTYTYPQYQNLPYSSYPCTTQYGYQYNYYNNYCYNYSTYVPTVMPWSPYSEGNYGGQRRYPHDDYYYADTYSGYY